LPTIGPELVIPAARLDSATWDEPVTWRQSHPVLRFSQRCIEIGRWTWPVTHHHSSEGTCHCWCRKQVDS